MNFSIKLCPFCKEDNKCKVNESGSCWCMKSKVPSELIKLVSSELKGKSCICQNCVEFFVKDKEEFKRKYGFI